MVTAILFMSQVQIWMQLTLLMLLLKNMFNTTNNVKVDNKNDSYPGSLHKDPRGPPISLKVINTLNELLK